MSYTLPLLCLVLSQGVCPFSPRPFSTTFSLSFSPGCVSQSSGPAGSLFYCPAVWVPLGSYCWVLESEPLVWGFISGLQACLAVPWNLSLLCFLSGLLQL